MLTYLPNGHNSNGYHDAPDLPGTVPDKLEPANIEAEEAVLGSILISMDAMLELDELDLTTEDFFIHKHRWIYAAMQSLRERNKHGLDLLTLSDELARQGYLEEIGGLVYLSGLMNSVPTHTHARYYGEIVKRDSISRQLIAAAGKIARLAHAQDTPDPASLIAQASDILLDVSTVNQGDQPQPASVFCNQFLDDLDSHKSGSLIGLPTGLADLDRLLNGLQRGKLYILGGRPGMGKSSLALQMAVTGAKKRNAKTLYISREMLGVELVERMICAEVGLDSDAIKKTAALTPEQWQAIFQATEQVSKWPIVIDDRTRLIESIRVRAIAQKYKHGLDLLIVDYLQRVWAGGSYGNRNLELAAVSSALKNLALDLNIPVVAVSSLSRQCESRAIKKPILSDLKESGDIEYDADVVIFNYCDDVYNPDTEFPNIAEINVAKHRGGKTGMLQAYFKRHLTTFIDLEVKKQRMEY